MRLLFAPSLTTANACELYYDQGLAVFQLLSDDGSTWTGAAYPDTPTSVSNSQCTVSGTGSNVTIDGNSVTMMVNVTFAAGFGGGPAVNSWLYADDGSGSSGWVSIGSWQPPPGINVSVIPVAATLSPGQNVQLGAQAIGPGREPDR